MTGRTLVFSGAALGLSTVRAFAEVCDKERPNWKPGELDHADRIASLTDVFASFPALIVCALFMVAIVVQHRWVRFGVACVLAAMAAVLATGMWHPDLVTSFAITEGCVATPLYAAGVFALMAVSILWISREQPTPKQDDF